MKQVYNPYLPSFEYVPDGEPHLFGNRIYLYGSHDRCGSAGFCLNDYVCYSASVDNLKDWRYEGVIYRKEQDPRNQNIPVDAPEQMLLFGIKPQKEEDLNPRGVHAMWAPDVVCGPDGRYYLYYCLDFLPEIGVAVSDSPTGPFEYLGFVCHKDGIPLGTRKGDYLQFDPGIFVDDDGSIYLYSGNAPISLDYEPPRQQSQVMTLEADMMTIKTEPKKLMPDVRDHNPEYENHEFFEASSIRKINGTYYFVYSSVRSNELCYATSKYPDRDYHFGGTLVSIGDVFLNGREEKDALNHLGNTHGGIERAGDHWYVFYHRQTNRTNYSRQGCAEEIFFDENGHIAQVPISSCGLNQGPLAGAGSYPAAIACYLLGKNGATYSHPDAIKMDYPFFTQDENDFDPTEELIARDREVPVQYVRNVNNGSVMGYRAFRFENSSLQTVEIRGSANGKLKVYIAPQTGDKTTGDVSATVFGEKTAVHHCVKEDTYLIGECEICCDHVEWNHPPVHVKLPDGAATLYLRYEGEGSLDIRRLIFG